MPKDVYVIDLFCGCGGFSTGARQAGAKVILAVDCWKEALEVHEANHQETEHLCESLGGDLDEFASFIVGFIDLNVPAGGHVHVHASPPCQKLSSVNTSQQDYFEGRILVDWTLQLIQLMQPHIATWSLEQVPHKGLMELVHRHSGVVIHMNEYGIPQTRTRLLLGNIDWQRLEPSNKDPVSLEHVMKSHGILATGFDTVNNGSVIGRRRGMMEKNADGTSIFYVRNFTACCYTVTGSQPVFYNSETHIGHTMPLNIIMALQTFPATYIVHVPNKVARRLIANAVPPEFSKALIKVVQSQRIPFLSEAHKIAAHVKEGSASYTTK